MKQKMIYISDEMFEALKQENASALIERLCREHFKSQDTKTMTEEQRQIRIKELEIKLEAMKKLREMGVENVSI